MNEEGGNPKQGLDRLHAFWKYVFQHQDPEEKVGHFVLVGFDCP